MNKLSKYFVGVVVVSAIITMTVLLIITPSKSQLSSQNPPITLTASSQTPFSMKVVGSGSLFYQISWNVIGSLSGCTIRVDSSADAVSWNNGDIIANQSCTTSGNATSTANTVNFVRVNSNSTITGSGSLVVLITGYMNNPGSAGGFGATLVQGQALIGNSVLQAVPTSSVLDASAFTGADWCAKVNAAYLALPANGGVIDGRGFSSSQACNSNPYHGANKAVVLLLPNGGIVSSVPWFTPNNPNIIKGTVSGNGNSNAGSFIDFCGSLSTSWVSTQCVVGGINVPQFPNATNQITFHNVPHGPIATGTYACGICGGGQGGGAGETLGWNSDGFAHIVQDVKLIGGGNSNIFLYYSVNDEERSYIDDVQGSLIGANSACFFWDRTEANTNQSGPTHFNVGSVTCGQGANNTATTWAVIVEGSVAPCVVTGGGGTGGTCFVSKIPNTGTPFVSVGYPGTGYTSNPTYTVWGAPVTTYGGAQISDCTGTINEVGGFLTTIVSQCAATDYPTGLLASGPEHFTGTLNGVSSTMGGGLYLGGVGNPRIDYIHCEHLITCVQLGSGYDAVSAGFYSTIDGTFSVTGDLIRIGSGADCQQNFYSVQFTSVSGTPNVIHDSCLISGTIGQDLTYTTAQVQSYGSIKNIEFYSGGGTLALYGGISHPYKATASLTIGQVVKVDTANSNSVVTTATTDTAGGIALGVMANGTASGNYGFVQTEGVNVSSVLGTGTCTVGQFVIVDTTTNGRVKCTSVYTAGTVLGYAMVANSSVGTPVVMLVQIK